MFPGLAARRLAPPAKKTPPSLPVDPTAISLGINAAGKPVTLGAGVRTQHLHVIGSSGGGKSNALQHIARQVIDNGEGLLVIDPHGSHPKSVFRGLLASTADAALSAGRRVHVIDPNDPTHVTGIQLFARPTPATDISVVAAGAFEAMERVFGSNEAAGKATIVTPTIRRILLAIFAAAAELELTFVELPALLLPYDDYGLRAWAIETLKDVYARAVLIDLHQMSLDDKNKRDYRAEIVGPMNRLAEFVRSPAIRNILGVTERSLDFGEVLARSDIVLMNAAGGERVASMDAEVLARIVLRTIFFHIERRQPPFRPFTIMIDECHKVLTGDVERMLAEVRKQAVAIVASHQNLAQLGKPDDPMRVAVLGNTNVKIVFRLRDVTEAKELAEAVVPLDLERPVSLLVRPTVVGHERTLFRSTSTGRNRSTSRSKGITETDSVAETLTESSSETFGESLAESVTDTEGVSHSRSRSVTEGESVGDSVSHTSGSSWSESVSEGSSESEGSSTTIGMEVPAGTDAVTAGNTIDSARRGVLGSSVPTSRSEGRDRSAGTSRSVTSSVGGSDAVTTGRTRTRSHAETVGESTSRSRSRAVGQTVGVSRAVTHGTSRGVTVGHSTGTTRTVGESDGTSETAGLTEGLEPIYATLPTAVHSIENVRYQAAQLLRGLPTGQAYVSFVTAEGMQSARVRIPEIRGRELSEAEFAALREKALAASGSAVPIEEAEAEIAERERRLLAEAGRIGLVDEPATFRVAAPRRLPSRRSPEGKA